MDETFAGTDSGLPSGLYIIATPIGNMGDITLRALEVLGKVDAIACEDTRISGKLTALYGLSAQKIPYHDHNAAEMRPRLIAMLKEGKRLALISDAGMPLISDPGYKLVEQCAAEGLPMTCIPGASASLAALVLSGLPTDKFLFAGFLPPKSAARRTALAEIKAVAATLVFYETAPRLADSLADMQEILGDRPAAVARALTKKFEEVKRGPLSALVDFYQAHGDPRGEIVVVVGAPRADQAESWTEKTLDDLLVRMMDEQGMSVKDAAAFVAAKSGIKKRDVYQRALLLSQKKK
ncbi:MAG: 16S rRNA (cytidine(1402)-2'-O)-methyltransferase [Alphaproteobacteria bacterium]|nr:16S rRNA (cytidine(1402)-2'-O)-methyltransferase [Alphaproteobacteria bacterium]